MKRAGTYLIAGAPVVLPRREMERRPNPSCRKCYGRGYVGKRKDGSFVLCTCFRMKEKK